MPDDNTLVARNEAEANLLKFVMSAEAKTSFAFTKSTMGQPHGLMHLARDCYERGLVVLVQKRVGTEIHYLAVKCQAPDT